MSQLLPIEKRNAVLRRMAELLEQERTDLKNVNQQDLKNYSGDDLAMEKRLLVDDAKIDGMILSLQQLFSQEDPVGKIRFDFTHENGLKIYNKTAAFGTIMIIYESRPDVTVEAGGIAFKSGNKILLKGGKESLLSNLKIVGECKIFKEVNTYDAYFVYAFGAVKSFSDERMKLVDEDFVKRYPNVVGK